MDNQADRRVWTEVDAYIEHVLHESDESLSGAIRRSAAAGLPNIAVSPAQGKLLSLFARTCAAKSILEIGTLGGYSTIWLARALASGGHMVTLEIEPGYAAVARENLRIAGVDDRVQVRVGAAIESLPALERDMQRPFDFIFIDADKPSNPAYLQWALKLTRPGSLIVVDNVIRGGDVIDPQGDERVQGARRVLEMMGSDPRLNATAIQTVGAKGYDGFALAIVQESQAGDQAIKQSQKEVS
jgi:spermidine synthase